MNCQRFQNSCVSFGIWGDFDNMAQYYNIHVLPSFGIYQQPMTLGHHLLYNNTLFKIMIVIGFILAVTGSMWMSFGNIPLNFLDISSAPAAMFLGGLILFVGGLTGMCINESCKNRKINQLLFLEQNQH